MKIQDYENILSPKDLKTTKSLPKLNKSKVMNHFHHVGSKSQYQSTIDQFIEKKRIVQRQNLQKTYAESFNETITDRELTKLFQLSTSPILNEVASKKIDDLRKTYSDQFYTHLLIASKGVPSFFNVDLDTESEKIRLQELKRQNQSLLSNVSSTKSQMKELIKPRKEVIDIIEWLDNNLNKLDIQQNKINELFKQKQQLFQACITELVRQISVDCKERGLLIKLLWNNNQDLVNEMISYLLLSKEEQEKKHLKQSNKMHITYQQELKRISDETKDLKKQIQEKNYELASLENENNYQLKKILKLEKQIKVNNKQYYLMQKDYQEVLNENIKLSMAQQNIDWELAAYFSFFQFNIISQIKQNMLNYKNHNVVESLKKIEKESLKQKESEDEQQEQVNQMVEKYLTDVNQEVQDIVDIEEGDKKNLVEGNTGLLQDQSTDTNDLKVNKDEETDTDGLSKTKDFSVQYLYDQNTQICQTDTLPQRNALSQTELETYEEYCQTDFKYEIPVVNVVESAQKNSDVQQGKEEDEQIEDTEGDFGQQKEQNQRVKGQQLEVVEQVDEEDNEDDARIKENKMKASEILRVNDMIKELMKDKKVNEVRKLISMMEQQNSNLIKEFVEKVNKDMQCLTQEKQELRNSVITQVIELEQNDDVISQQREFLQMLQKDLQDLEEMAAVDENENLQNESKVSNVTISSPTNFQDVVQQLQFKKKEALTQPKQPRRNSFKQSQIQTQKKNSLRKEVNTSGIANASRKPLSRQVSMKQVIEDKKHMLLKQKGLTVRQPYTHKSQNAEIASILLINSYHQAQKEPVAPVKPLVVQNVLKTLQLVFLELLKLNRKNEKIQNALHVYIYEHCMQKFGLKNVAERNYQYTIQNLYHLRKDTDHFQLLNKLVFSDELQSSKESSINELIKTLPQNGTQLGFVLNLVSNLDEYNQRNTCVFDKMFTTLFKIKDTYPKWLGDMISQDQLFRCVEKLEKDGHQPMSSISLFKFIQEVLDLSATLLQTLEKNISLLIDQAPFILLSSFMLYFRVLEKSELSRLDLMQEFEDHADMFDDIINEIAMSKREFTLFCSRHRLFSQSKIQKVVTSIFKTQNQFQMEDFSYLNKCLQLKKKWEKRAKKLKWTFFQRKRYTNAHKKIMDLLSSDLEVFEQSSGQELERITQRICFNYGLLKRDSRLLSEDLQIFELIPPEFSVAQFILVRKIVPKSYALIQK